MATYTFSETIDFFSEKLKAEAPEEDITHKKVELVIDEFHLLVMQGRWEGSLHLKMVLGLMLQPLREQRLKELACSNFLGVNTGGCHLAFDAAGVTLSLHCHTTAGTSPQENWEWLHRIVSVAREWNKVLALWDEFVSLTTPKKEREDERRSDPPFRKNIRG